MRNLLEPLRAAAKPNLILDCLGAFMRFAHIYPPALLNSIFASGKYIAWIVACRCPSPDALRGMQACTPHVCGAELVCKNIR